MNYWSVDSEENETEWDRATWNFNSGYYKDRREREERLTRRPDSFAEEPEAPTYDPWTGGWF